MSDVPSRKLQKLETIQASTKISRDFYIGSIKVLNNTYLPKWSGETQAGYDTRVASTKFVNMYAPVIESIAGLVTKKNPTVQGYESIDTKNIDLKNNTLEVFIKDTIKQSLIDGVVFTAAETSTKYNRAFLKNYTYENLYSFRYEDNTLTQIVFREKIEVEDGLFGLKAVDRFIVFRVGGGELWYSEAEGEDPVKKDEWTNSLPEIPVTATITGKTLSVYEIIPKFLDIALLNNVHLNLSSNLANVLGVVGNPVPVFYGQTKEGSVTIGVKDALVFNDRQKEGFEYVEIEGAGVDKLQGDISDTEKQIDKLTFNMLVQDDSNTVIDAEQNQSKNSSFLSDVAAETESSFQKLLEWMILLENKTLSSDALFEMQKDFDLTMIDIKIAYDLLLAREMSRETFYHVLRNGKLPKDFNIEEENQNIESNIV